MNKNESEVAAAKREVQEETGLEFPLTDFSKLRTVYIKESETHHFVYHMFKVSYDGSESVTLNENEHQNFAWVSANEALEKDLMEDEDACINLVYQTNRLQLRRISTFNFSYNLRY